MKKIYSVMILCVAVVTSMLFVSCERDIVPTETVLSVIDEKVTPSYTSCTIACTFYTDATIDYASVQYSTTEDFARYNVTKMTKNTDDGSYSVELTKLQVNTTYYFRYEVNACVFTSSQADKVSEFQTLTSSVPVVVTTSATDISTTSATVGGILYDAGFEITECGIVCAVSQNPTTANAKFKSNGWDDAGLFTCKLTGLSAGNTYYARAYVISEKGTAYGKDIKFIPGMQNDHMYVDLGLSVKWATCNVGTNKPEGYGDYFSWGETQPKDDFEKDNYKWYNWSYNVGYTLTKYCTSSSSGTGDNKTQLDLSDDAARTYWGGSWRMPTEAEFTELREQCTWTWTTQNGVKGYEVTSMKSGYTNQSIFLPAAGYRSGSSLSDAGYDGHYWSSSLSAVNSSDACRLEFESYGVYSSGHFRYLGLSVRPVCP
jgi:hypothetical protein